MFDPKVPYNDLPPITTLDINASAGLPKLAEDTRVAIEILNYAVKTLPDPNILLDTLALQEARASSNIENIVTTNDDLYRGVVFEDFTAEATGQPEEARHSYKPYELRRSDPNRQQEVKRGN